ncbi:kinase-like domain-containing protein [Bipolaris maydis]|nr:kinase-like domain-containing protein [Bipolaris maydis]
MAALRRAQDIDERRTEASPDRGIAPTTTTPAHQANTGEAIRATKASTETARVGEVGAPPRKTAIEAQRGKPVQTGLPTPIVDTTTIITITITTTATTRRHPRNTTTVALHPLGHHLNASSPVSGSGYNSDTSRGRRDDDKMRGAYHYQGRGGFQQSPPYPSHNQYSPQNQSPYHSGRGGWSNQPYPNHGSPPHGYTSGQSPYHQSQSPSYYSNQSYPQSGFQSSSHRGGHGGFRGNSFHGSDRRISGPAGGAPFSGPGGRGRGAAPTQFSNLSWTPASGTRGGRPATEAPRPQPLPTSQTVADSTSVDADDNPFRPSKDLRVEDEGSKEEQKPATPAKSSATLPTATKSGFGFSLKTKNPVPPASKSKLGLEEPEKAEPALKESLLDPKAKVEAARDVAPRYTESRSDRDRDPRERDYDHNRERDLRERDIRERDRRYDNYYDRKPAYRDPRERDPRDIRDSRDPYYRGRERDFRDPRDRDFRDPRDVRDGRDIRERDSRDLRDPRDIRDTRDRREPYFPRRHDDRRPDTRPITRPERRTPPPQISKTRTITRKREKPRPTLAPEHAASESVYYRKPGNESVVGSGTYGKVFKGVHVYTKDMVALKKIRMEGERDGFPVTAIREVKLLQSLNHPNIVNLREVMVEKNDCYMVFEYLSHDLTGLLNHPTFKLETSHKKDLAKQLFEGLDYLHRRGVLHRDIKAANILVSNTGQLKLADFGLARFYSKSGKLDYTNRVITIWYRSPELLLGETQYGPAVDIWSAACVLVEIFTRHAIFPGDGGEINQLEKIYNVLGTPTVQDWPGIVDMQWFELLRPTERKKSTFAEKYKDRVSPMAFELLQAMFLFDPNARPAAADVLEHPFFTSEAPAPKRAEALKELEGDWHEFESKALRKEKEKQDKEARRAAREEKDNARKDEGKRRADAVVGEERDAKRAKSGDVTA